VRVGVRVGVGVSTFIAFISPLRSCSMKSITW
jgi:hypothetical protein